MWVMPIYKTITVPWFLSLWLLQASSYVKLNIFRSNVLFCTSHFLNIQAMQIIKFVIFRSDFLLDYVVQSTTINYPLESHYTLKLQ